MRVAQRIVDFQSLPYIVVSNRYFKMVTPPGNHVGGGWGDAECAQLLPYAYPRS